MALEASSQGVDEDGEAAQFSEAAGLADGEDALDPSFPFVRLGPLTVGLTALLPCLLVALPLLGGCAHQRAVETPTPTAAAEAPAPQVSKADMKFKSVYLENLTVAKEGVAETDPKPYVADTQTSLLDQLKASALFDDVKLYTGGEPKQGALLVRGEVTSLRIVSGAARFWVGAMAGNSDMAVHVKLVDAATGAAVAEDDVKGDSNAWAGGWTIGGSDRSLPSRVGAHIAEYVVFKAKK